jgi:hypothetical protein
MTKKDYKVIAECLAGALKYIKDGKVKDYSRIKEVILFNLNTGLYTNNNRYDAVKFEQYITKLIEGNA